MQKIAENATDGREFVVPENFSMVEKGVYRSSFPRTRNIAFMKHLRLKSVVSLVPEDYPAGMLEFYNSTGIKLLSHGLGGNKWPFKEIDYNDLISTMRDVLNEANRPLLIHCNKGKHRTGSVVGCLRKIRGWALSAIFNEYLLYASPKTRFEDQQMIEIFEVKDIESDNTTGSNCAKNTTDNANGNTDSNTNGNTNGNAEEHTAYGTEVSPSSTQKPVENNTVIQNSS
jgi:tyrosine-protein phosphatase SIW14